MKKAAFSGSSGDRCRHADMQNTYAERLSAPSFCLRVSALAGLAPSALTCVRFSGVPSTTGSRWGSSRFHEMIAIIPANIWAVKRGIVPFLFFPRRLRKRMQKEQLQTMHQFFVNKPFPDTVLILIICPPAISNQKAGTAYPSGSGTVDRCDITLRRRRCC